MLSHVQVIQILAPTLFALQYSFIVLHKELDFFNSTVALVASTIIFFDLKGSVYQLLERLPLQRKMSKQTISYRKKDSNCQGKSDVIFVFHNILCPFVIMDFNFLTIPFSFPPTLILDFAYQTEHYGWGGGS